MTNRLVRRDRSYRVGARACPRPGSDSGGPPPLSFFAALRMTGEGQDDRGGAWYQSALLSLADVASSMAGKRAVSRVPTIQPMAPRPTVSPSQISNTEFRDMLCSASIAARIIPIAKPRVTPTRHPGCARLRPRKRFIIEQLLSL